MSEPDEARITTRDDVSIRRAPKYPAFIIVGAGLGAIVTFILTALFPVDPTVGFGALFGYFALYGITAGALVGALLALLADRISLRRARAATIELTTVGNPAEVVDEPQPAAEKAPAKNPKKPRTPKA